MSTRYFTWQHSFLNNSTVICLSEKIPTVYKALLVLSMGKYVSTFSGQN